MDMPASLHECRSRPDDGGVQLETATSHIFEPHLASEFLAERESAGRVALRLTEIRALGRQPGAPRVEPFALVFSGPPAPVLPQATYTLEHGALGTLELFLVPIGRDAEGGVQYEAVFN
jgi:Domain of unknown function (DUF6916)